MVAIVVASEKVARDCIRFLKEERAEPETFLALDYLDIKPINERLREIKGCKMMIDVIKTQFPQLKKVIQFVCGNGLVCETVEEARHIAFGGPERRKELMKTLRKEADLKQIQTLVQGTNTRLKYSQNELETIKKKHLVAFYREQSQLQSELLNIDSQCAMLNEGINKQQQKIEEFQDKIDKVEDEIFQDFCEEIGVENIREFENKHVKQQQENDQKRLEFEKQKTRLNIQLEYSQNQLKKKLNKINTLKMTIQKDREDIDSLKKTEEECLKSVDELMAKQEQIKEVFATESSNIEKIHIQIEEERKKFLVIDREVGKLQKDIVIIQGSLEQKLLEKHNLLLDCKVQDIEISLVLGSLEDIIEVESISSKLTETESTQATADIYEKEAAIQIDYSPLREDLKNWGVRDSLVLAMNTICLQQRTRVRQVDLLRMTTTPNLRAQENLKAVRDKFQESADAFEASRKEARVCRQEFEQVKRCRYDAFSQCFEYISVSIDQIYKKLCKNSSAQAFLSPENPEEPYLDGISYNCVAPGKRFMPMDNLSGGEKCVAALALLFAVHRIRLDSIRINETEPVAFSVVASRPAKSEEPREILAAGPRRDANASNTEIEVEKSAVVAVVTEPQFTQRYREYLEKQKLLDRQHRVEKLQDGMVALPVLAETLPEEHLQELRNRVAPGSTYKLTQLLHPVPSKKARVCTPAQRLCLEQWKSLEPELRETVASALGIQRLAKRGRVLPDGTRTPSVTLLLGDHGWVEHMDNGIRYKFDVTQCMFSFRNITEKVRVASLSCAGEVLVNLYAGIGYFTLPFLVHARAAFVHACEWNPHAVVALRNNLEINGVADRCQIHFGDNRKLQLSNTADRVNLRLIPSSEEGLPIACQVLRKDVGGILHIHQNVESFSGKNRQPLGCSNTGKEHWPHPSQIITDEVDAALDNTNIGKVSSYIKEQSQEQFQMIIISLKEEFYSRADALIGIYPEHDECMFSHVLTLDLSKYPDTEDQEGSRRHRKPRASRASQSSQSPQSR
ncbi:structural maintenance of chromosomes protein 1B [Sigmodon hispidus]